jgi:hypothetical protein
MVVIMHDVTAKKIAALVCPEDLIINVGGWATPFNRANYVIDFRPYETRCQCNKKNDNPQLQGEPNEHFSEKTWIRRDLCDREPWPFKDKSIDFCLCVGILEQLRDPIWVCSEMVRVAKLGYIEVTSRLAESSRGREPGVPVGYAANRWLVDVEPPTITFTTKGGLIYGDDGLSFSESFGDRIPQGRNVTGFFWENEFLCREGSNSSRDELASYKRHNRPIEDLERRLSPTIVQIEELRAQLDRFQGVGPMGIRLGRRLHRASNRYPRVASEVKRFVHFFKP